MNASELLERIQEALHKDDTDSLQSLVSSYKTSGSAEEAEDENKVLQWIGMYGASGRTDRYQPLIDQLIQNDLQPNLISCSFLGLHSLATNLITDSPEAVKTEDTEGNTPLHAAAERGDVRMVAMLVSAGADPNKPNSAGEYAIERALHAGPWKVGRADDVVNVLKDRTGDQDWLWLAVALGDAQQVETILTESPESVNSQSPRGETPLFIAAHNNQPDLVERLLQAGADASAFSRDNQTALDTACLHRLSGECHLSIISALQDRCEARSLAAAIVLNDLQSIQVLVQEGTQEHLDLMRMSAVSYAIHTGSAKATVCLLKLGQETTAEDRKHLQRIFKNDQDQLAEMQKLLESEGQSE